MQNPPSKKSSQASTKYPVLLQDHVEDSQVYKGPESVVETLLSNPNTASSTASTADDSSYLWSRLPPLHDISDVNRIPKKKSPGVYQRGSSANIVLYVGLGMMAVGLVITFVGIGERGFNAMELKLIGPSLIASGAFFCFLRIFFCTCPYCCRKHCECCFTNCCGPNDVQNQNLPRPTSTQAGNGISVISTTMTTNIGTEGDVVHSSVVTEEPSPQGKLKRGLSAIFGRASTARGKQSRSSLQSASLSRKTSAAQGGREPNPEAFALGEGYGTKVTHVEVNEILDSDPDEDRMGSPDSFDIDDPAYSGPFDPGPRPNTSYLPSAYLRPVPKLPQIEPISDSREHSRQPSPPPEKDPADELQEILSPKITKPPPGSPAEES